MDLTTYPYSVTINCQGKNTIERVIAFSVYDAVMQALLQFTSAKNIAGEDTDDAIVMRVEPDFTMVRRPEPDETVSDHLASAVAGGISVSALVRMAGEVKSPPLSVTVNDPAFERRPDTEQK